MSSDKTVTGTFVRQYLLTTLNSDKTVTAVFKQKFTLTMSRQGDGGSLNPGVGSHVYFDGDSVSVSATGTSNWEFDHWEDALTGTDTPQTLNMNANKNVTGVFLPLHTLTTSIEGQGTGSVTPSGGEYKHGTEVWLVPTAGSKSWFVEWHDDLTGSDIPGRLVMSGQKHVSAEFDTNRLTVSVQGQGTVSPSSGNYAMNEEVEVAATPAENWYLDHWTGDEQVEGSTSLTLTLTMDEDKSITAVFKQIFTLTMAKVPGSATGSVDPLPGEHIHKEGEQVTLTCTDSATWLFGYWTGQKTGNANPTSITMTEDKSVCAHFVTLDKIQYDDGSGYVDVPNPLQTFKNASVTFKAIPSPVTSAQWPQGKPAWSGTSGASGAGETKSVTFNSPSSSPTDYKTVIAECGQSSAANVLVVGTGEATVWVGPQDWDAGGYAGDTFDHRVLDNTGFWQNRVVDENIHYVSDTMGLTPTERSALEGNPVNDWTIEYVTEHGVLGYWRDLSDNHWINPTSTDYPSISMYLQSQSEGEIVLQQDMFDVETQFVYASHTLTFKFIKIPANDPDYDPAFLAHVFVDKSGEHNPTLWANLPTVPPPP